MSRPLLVVLVFLLAACGGSSVTPPAPSATTSPSPATATPVMAFFLKDGVVAPVRRTSRSADESQRLVDAVEAVLAGPTAAEAQAGYATDIPAGTSLRALTVRSGAVAIDLSRNVGTPAIPAALAQLTFTATQVDLAASVTVTVDGAATGAAAGRDAFEALSPPILVLTPLPGDSVGSPIRVAGTANVFEAQFSLDLVAGGQVVTVPVKATAGTGTRGGFAVSVDADGYRGPARLVPWDASPRDGSRVESPAIPIVIT